MNTIKRKILLLLTLSMSASMLLAGISLSIIIKNNYEKSAEIGFNNFYERARSTFKKIHINAKFYSDELAERETVKNALNLISEYSDINNYQAEIYDNEKKNIASILHDYAKSSQLHEIRVYDENGWLTAFTIPSHTAMGIVSFEKVKPLVIISKIGDGIWEVISEINNIPPMKINNLHGLDKSNYIKYENILGVETKSHIVKTYIDGIKKHIGSLYIVKPIDNTILTALSKSSNAHHGILLPSNNWVGDEIKEASRNIIEQSSSLFNNGKDIVYDWVEDSNYFIKVFSIALSDDNKAYLVSSLNRSIVNNQVNETLFVIFMIFLIVLLVLLPVGLLFSRYSITSPLDSLVKSAKSLEAGNYESFSSKDNISIEFNVLAEALNSAANTVREREIDLHKAQELLEKRVEERTNALVISNNELQKENIERVEAEERLSESTKMLQLVVDNIPQFVFWKDINSKYLGCNKIFSISAGFEKPEDIIGKTDYQMPWTKEESDSYRLVDRRVMNSDEAEIDIHETLQTVEGNEIQVETNKVPLHDFNGNVIGILGTFQDITKRNIYEKEIIKAKDMAEKANQAKSDFLSHMSHELRTPLNAILGFAQLLEMNVSKFKEPQINSNINEILSAGEHLLNLINEILDLARIESSELIIELESVNSIDVLNESIKLTSALAESNNISIKVNSSNCKQPHVFVDATRLKQIFINFITNSIKYNKEDGTVVIECVCEDDNGVKFKIIDTGIGMKQENIEKLFTPFERLGMDKEAIDGTGIGLVICKQLIELMGGSLGVESKLGEGSCFWFTFPHKEKS